MESIYALTYYIRWEKIFKTTGTPHPIQRRKMRKIVLEVNDNLYNRLVCLVLSGEKSFSQLVLDMFEKDCKAKDFYNELYQDEFEKLTNEETQ